MDLFLDCEWADVLASELVSLALVSADGRHIFYGEIDPLPTNPSDWVRAVVYPLLDRGESAMPAATLTRQLREFLAQMDSPRICYDFGVDRSLCQYAIDGFEVPEPSGPIPAGLQWQLCEGLQPAIERWWVNHPERLARRHHALEDAQAFRAGALEGGGFAE